MGITIADIIETISINTKLNILFHVRWNTKNGSTKINSDSMDRGINIPAKTIAASIAYG